MEHATGKGTAAAITIRGTESSSPEREFRGDLLELVYKRVNRCDPRRISVKYARLEDHSTMLMGRIAAVADPEAGQLLNRLDAILAVLGAMAMELAYQRGMADGMRVGMGGLREREAFSASRRTAPL